MKFVMSAIVLLAFVFILTSCHWDGSALAGMGEAKDPYTKNPTVQVSEQPVLHTKPQCSMEVQATGAVYIDPAVLHSMAYLFAHNNRLEVRLNRTDGLLPKLETARYQAHPDKEPATPLIRTMLCHETTDAGKTDERVYECVVPKAGNNDDSKTFYFESLELRIDGYPNLFSFHEALAAYPSDCDNYGTDVTFRDYVLPILNPADAPSY